MKSSHSAILIAIVAVVAFSGCSRRQAMYKQDKYRPFGYSEFFDDHRTSRPLVPGVVPTTPLDDHLNTGLVDGKPVNSFPFPIGRKEIERGMNRFNIYCTPCHSRTGDGWGMVVQRGFKRPPAFTEARLKAAPVSHFFNVITNGIGMMSGYAAQVTPADRWAIIAYIRALQLSQDARIGDVPAEERTALEATK